MEQVAQETNTVITPQDFVDHWQGHRRLTRRVIEAFPEKEFFSFSIGGMRPFYELAMEMLDIAKSGISGLVTGNWESLKAVPDASQLTKADILKQWDEVTAEIDELWPQIPISRFQEKIVTFGQYESTGFASVFYWIENEVHHRGQGYVYLRALGITPPFFWER